MDDTTPGALDLALAYYRAIDGVGEEPLEALLAPGFVQERSDRTFDGRDAFVRFMREERPDPETTHEVRACFQATDGPERDIPHSEPERSDGERVAIQGRVHRSDGTPWFDFLDVFTVSEGRIQRLETYSR